MKQDWGGVMNREFGKRDGIMGGGFKIWRTGGMHERVTRGEEIEKRFIWRERECFLGRTVQARGGDVTFRIIVP